MQDASAQFSHAERGAARPMSQSPGDTACIGLRAKTARAIGVVLAGSRASPQAVARTEIILASSATPAMFQPYHQVMNLPWDRATSAVRESEQAIEAAASTALKALVDELRSRGFRASNVGIVGAPERNLAAIASPHIRAHAAEGVLFRRVLEVGAESNDLPWVSFADRDFEKLAASRLGLPIDPMQTRLADIGRALGRPWRADQKAAAIAAWIGLAGQGAA